MKGRQILDGGLIANEAIHWLRKKKKEVVILKLDFHKAFDSIKWVFIDQILESMDFGRLWCKWIRCYLSAEKMSIIINGSPIKPFKMERGLRQGDPLSPFLFVLVGEVLNKLLHKVENIGLIKGIKVGRQEVTLTHNSQITQSCLVPQNVESMLNLKRILDCSSLMSSLKINYGKSALFPINCNDILITGINHKLNCMVFSLPTS